MALGKKKEENIEPVEENVTLAEIVENEEDKKILEPVVETKPKSVPPYLIGYIVPDRSFLRKEANIYSDIVAFLNKNQGLAVNMENSTDDFYYVTVDCRNGYVVKTDVAFND